MIFFSANLQYFFLSLFKARYIANLVFENAPIEKIEKLFLAGENAAQILPINDILHSSSPNNYLPQMPDLSPDNTTQAAYMQLGMMVMLDYENRNDISKNKIENYYEKASHHLQNQSVFIALDYSKKPISYVAWKKISDNSIDIIYQSAPFTDSKIMLKSLQQRLPNDTVIINSFLKDEPREQSAL